MVSIEVEAGDEHINDEELTDIRDRSAGSEMCAVEEWPTHRDEDLKRHLCEHLGVCNHVKQLHRSNHIYLQIKFLLENFNILYLSLDAINKQNQMCTTNWLRGHRSRSVVVALLTTMSAPNMALV